VTVNAPEINFNQIFCCGWNIIYVHFDMLFLTISVIFFAILSLYYLLLDFISLVIFAVWWFSVLSIYKLKENRFFFCVFWVYCKTIDQYSLQICPAAALINRISDQCRVCQKYTIYNITGTVLSSRPLKSVNN
jgi:hypothetical protein